MGPPTSRLGACARWPVAIRAPHSTMQRGHGPRPSRRYSQLFICRSDHLQRHPVQLLYQPPVRRVAAALHARRGAARVEQSREAAREVVRVGHARLRLLRRYVLCLGGGADVTRAHVRRDQAAARGAGGSARPQTPKAAGPRDPLVFEPAAVRRRGTRRGAAAGSRWRRRDGARGSRRASVQGREDGAQQCGAGSPSGTAKAPPLAGAGEATEAPSRRCKAASGFELCGGARSR